MKNTILIIILAINLYSYSQNIEKGNLDDLKKLNVIEELQKLSGTKIDNSKIIVINFYDSPKIKPNGSCIDYYSLDKSYLKFFKKHPNILQFFITQKDYKYEKSNFIEDRNNIIRALIFENAQPCGNYVIIKPNGEFLKRLGEYRQDQIPDVIQKM